MDAEKELIKVCFEMTQQEIDREILKALIKEREAKPRKKKWSFKKEAEKIKKRGFLKIGLPLELAMTVDEIDGVLSCMTDGSLNEKTEMIKYYTGYKGSFDAQDLSREEFYKDLCEAYLDGMRK